MFERAGLRILDSIYEGSAGISMPGKIYIQALFRVANISICHPLAFWMDGGGKYEGEEHQLWKTRKLILLPNRRTSSHWSHCMSAWSFDMWSGGSFISNVLHFQSRCIVLKLQWRAFFFWTIWLYCWMARAKLNCTITNLTGLLECTRQRQNIPK